MAADSSVRIENGSFYLGERLYATYFAGTSAIAIMVHAGRIALVPLRQPGSGGFLLKVLNARGDRVIHAHGFLRELEFTDSERYDLTARWDFELSALTVPNPKATAAEALLRTGDDHGR